MNITSAADASTHAVSPVSIVGTEPSFFPWNPSNGAVLRGERRRSQDRRVSIRLRLSGTCGGRVPSGPMDDVFEFHEATIEELGTKLRIGEVTVRGLVEAYLGRIEALDRSGPEL